MGAGRPQEAEFSLVDGVPAGRYTLVADGIITGAVDVTFEVIWRRGGEPSRDVVLATWQHRFEPRPDGTYDAQPLELGADVSAITYEPGDQLVWRYNGIGTTPMAYVPNGEGDRANGRIPHLVLPP